MHDLFFVHVLLVTIRVDHLTRGSVIFEQERNDFYKNSVCTEAEVVNNFCIDGTLKHLFSDVGEASSTSVDGTREL